MAAATVTDVGPNGGQIAVACDHADAMPLGIDGRAEFFVCDCGVVLITQGDRKWALPRRN